MADTVAGCAEGRERDAVVGFLNEEGAVDARLRFEAHLKSCDACARELRLLTSMREALNGWGPRGDVPEFSTLLLANSTKADNVWDVFVRGWGLAAAATVAVMLVGGAAAYWYRSGRVSGESSVQIADRGAQSATAESADAGREPLRLSADSELSPALPVNEIGNLAAAAAGDAEALGQLRRAAGEGNATAQRRLGEMYRLGEGVERDFVLAHMWFNIAGANGSAAAREARQELEDAMVADEVAEATSRARACMDSNYQDCE